MSQTVGDFFVQRLHEWGVRRIFGYPGDGINGVLGSLQRDKDNHKIEFIQVRHEEMAPFMACAYAKFSGEMGVCLSTGGPGAMHMIAGLYDTKLDHMPVLAITGQAPRTARGAHYQQELNLDRMFADCADDVQEAEAPSQIRVVVDRAIRTAQAENGVSVLALPGDLQDDFYQDSPRQHGSVLSGVGYAKPKAVPYEADLRRAAEVLNAGKKVAMLVGAGALQAVDEVIAVADKLGAGAAKALLGKGVLPNDLPWVTGSIGYLGTGPSYDLMMECDTLLMIGSGFPYSEFLPKEGDSAETLRLLLPLLEQKTDHSWREHIERRVAHWWKAAEHRAMQPAHPSNPQRVAWELSPRLPDRAIITSDSGSCANWYARDLKIRRGMMCSLSGSLASTGAAVLYAIAAKFAHPDRPVIALVGDGAMQMNNMAEPITMSTKDWATPDWICCVWNNEDLNQVTWEQRVLEGNPKLNATQQIPDVPYHKFAELIGLRGIFCDDPDRVGAAWEEALASDRPVVLEFKTDPEVPSLPSHISLESARNFASTIIKGDPREGGMISGAARQVLSNLLPGGRE